MGIVFDLSGFKNAGYLKNQRMTFPYCCHLLKNGYAKQAFDGEGLKTVWLNGPYPNEPGVLPRNLMED